jgi:hypothetical protein
MAVLVSRGKGGSEKIKNMIRSKCCGGRALITAVEITMNPILFMIDICGDMIAVISCILKIKSKMELILHGKG